MLPRSSPPHLSLSRAPHPQHKPPPPPLPLAPSLSQAIMMMFPIHSVTQVGTTHSSPLTPFQDYILSTPVITQPSLSRLRERSLDLAGTAPSLPRRPLEDSLRCLLSHVLNSILGTQTQRTHTRQWHRIKTGKLPWVDKES